MTKKKPETLCGTCHQMVGVVTTRFNKTNPGEFVPKTSTHNDRNGVRCTGSRLSIHPNMVMDVA